MLQNYLQLDEKYDVVIERDHLGVPHVMGERDVDAAFGFAYAQAEDNWQVIHDSIPFIPRHQCRRLMARMRPLLIF